MNENLEEFDFKYESKGKINPNYKFLSKIIVTSCYIDIVFKVT